MQDFLFDVANNYAPSVVTARHARRPPLRAYGSQRGAAMREARTCMPHALLIATQQNNNNKGQQATCAAVPEGRK